MATINFFILKPHFLFFNKVRLYEFFKLFFLKVMVFVIGSIITSILRFYKVDDDSDSDLQRDEFAEESNTYSRIRNYIEKTEDFQELLQETESLVEGKTEETVSGFDGGTRTEETEQVKGKTEDFLEVVALVGKENFYFDTKLEKTQDIEEKIENIIGKFDFVNSKLEVEDRGHKTDSKVVVLEGKTEDFIESSNSGMKVEDNCNENKPDSKIDSDDISEHDEVIEQLVLELRNTRTGGLPTIFEESDYIPKQGQEVKPMKMNERYEQKTKLIEIQKVYKSYTDKMRKFDVLSSQTMHAISLLKLKDQTRYDTTVDRSSLKSVFLPNLFKRRKPEVNREQKVIEELCKDFETVYLGQICVSWETLYWQYIKAKEIEQPDLRPLYRFNEVAGDFQLFQVLVQRFLENEPFQKSSRVEYYVKNRCVSRKFLQVPIIRDDRTKCNKIIEGEEKYVVTIEALREIIWESMCVFLEFIRADKSETKLISVKHHQTRVAPENSLDLELLSEIKSDVQKKEKRVKDIIRSGNCIARKYQKHRDHRPDRLSYAVLIAQVELKLVSRMLNMSKLTNDQLVWCRDKLSEIKISGRKIYLETSFSFFPC